MSLDGVDVATPKAAARKPTAQKKFLTFLNFLCNIAPMKNTTRYVRLPKTVVDRLQLINYNRSAALLAAFKDVYHDPDIVLRELEERRNGRGMIITDYSLLRATVYLPEFVAGGFNDLVELLRLPGEDVARLAVEAFIRKALNEPARSLQPAPEG